MTTMKDGDMMLNPFSFYSKDGSYLPNFSVIGFNTE
jgi:hypothetical protein